MHKALPLLTSAMLVASTLSAQEPTNDGVRFGIKLSPSIAWLRSDTRGIESDGSQIGFTFGLLTEFPIGEYGNYRISTGGFINNIGGTFKTTYSTSNPTTNISTTTDVDLRYVEVPFSIKMMTSEIGPMRYYGQLGVSTAFNVRARADIDVATETGGTTTRTSLEGEDVKENTNLYKGGLIVGAGLEYSISGRTALLAGITYNNSFTGVFSRNGISGFENTRIFADYLELTVGVFF